MENISKKHRKKFEKIKNEMANTLQNAELLLVNTLNENSIIDNIATIRVQIALLQEFEKELVDFLGDALCLLKQPH